jgi:hypothetical protein
MSLAVKRAAAATDERMKELYYEEFICRSRLSAFGDEFYLQEMSITFNYS